MALSLSMNIYYSLLFSSTFICFVTLFNCCFILYFFKTYRVGIMVYILKTYLYINFYITMLLMWTLYTLYL